MSNLPFLKLDPGASSSPAKSGPPTPDAVRPDNPLTSGRGAPQTDQTQSGPTNAIEYLFEAAVSGVQSRFQHLSKEDIAHPPHQWFDAALARQIAIHLMVEQYAIPKRRIADRLERGRASIQRAIEVIDERLSGEAFVRTYGEIAKQVEAELAASEENDDD